MGNWGQFLCTQWINGDCPYYTKRKEGSMYENDIKAIKRAQKGDKEELEKLINENNRTNMEYSKEI